MSRKSRRSALAAAAAVLAGAWLCVALARALPVIREGRALAAAGNLDIGHALLTAVHGPGVDPAWRMPIGVLLETWMILASPRVGIILVGVVTGLDVLLTGALALFLGGPAAGLAAAAGWLWLLSDMARNAGSIKMLLYAFFVLLAAFGLALRARTPSPRADLAAGAALATGFLMRSVLLPLAPLVVLVTLIRGKPRSAALFLLPALLVLAPWVQFNRHLNGSWSVVEHGVTDAIIVGGIVGLTDTTAEGDYGVLAPDAPKGHGVAAWALWHVSAHPVDFLKLAAARLRFAFGLKPLLFALSLLGFLLCRKDPAARAAAMVAVLYLGAHVSFSTLAYLYEPLWPLLCVLAASSLAALAPPQGSPRRTELAAFTVSLAVALAASVAAEAAAIRYEFRTASRAPGSREALAYALEARPNDPLLQLERGRELLGDGDAPGALRVLIPAEASLPDLARISVERARAEELSGARGALGRLAAVLPAVTPFDDEVALRLNFYKADAAARRHARGEAAAAVAAAVETWRASQRLTVVRDDRERALEARMKAAAGEFLVDHVTALFDREPPERWEPGIAEAALAVEPALARGLALDLQTNGRYDLACPIFGKQTAAPGATARAWADLGGCSFLEGRRSAAVSALQRANMSEPSSAEYAVSLGAALESTGRSAEASALYARTLALKPRDAESPFWDELHSAQHPMMRAGADAAVPVEDPRR